jgi:tetratricopeptide (TPR) repeat protein
MSYADLELSLQRAGDDYTVEMRLELADGNTEARLIAGELPRLQLSAETLVALADDPGAYGARLTELLFADARVREAFACARAQAQLRLRLRLDANDALLQSIRWETLSDPDGSDVLCASESVLVTRYVDSADMTPLGLRSCAQLSALVAVANPAGLERYPGLMPVNVAGEVARSRDALHGITTTVLAREPEGRAVTLDAIVDGLRDGPDILYLVAHGTVKDGEAYIWLESDEGGVGRISGTELIEHIQALPDRPILVVLASCQSAGAGQADRALAAIGPRLAAAGIAAVLAMQGNITMETIADFMPVFFRELRRDGQIDRAMAAARASVLDRPDWWMPVLFLRVQNGMLWSAAPEALSLLDVPPPPQPECPPEVIDFVGRAAELAAFGERLATEHAAEITGMPGVGKTALAAMMARQTAKPEQIFWHSFRSGEGVDALIWALAGFLASNGQSELWTLLQRAQNSGAPPPPPDVLFDYLVPMLEGHGYLLCMDDFQCVDDDPQFEQFVDRLRPHLRAGTLALLVTSRRAPSFATLAEVEMLAGLSIADTRSLLAARSLELSDELVEQLYLQTEGNTQLLTLAIDALKRSSNPARLVGDLIDSDDITRYLMREVDEGLSDEERQVMRASAALLDYGGTRGALRAVLDGASIRNTLLALTERYLLTASEGPDGREYRPHAIIQAFYYDDLQRTERETLHRHAALYYALEEHDALRAAIHFERAGEDARAADLATTNAGALIAAGQANGLRQLLERFVVRQHEPANPRQLDGKRWLAVCIACGEVYARLGEIDQARERFQEAYDLLKARPDSPRIRERTAAVCRCMAELLEEQAPHEAIEWLRRGHAAGEGTRQYSLLALPESSALLASGAIAPAIETLKSSLRHFPEGALHWRGKARLNFSPLAGIEGVPWRSRRHSRAS